MKKDNLRNMTATAAMTSLLCALCPLTIPIGPIPFSLGVLAVFLSVVVLGTRRGTCAVALYLLAGFVGLPVFTGFAGGPAKALGPTGGFLAGYVPMALIAGYFCDRFPDSAAIRFAGMFAGLVALYAFGAGWLVLSLRLPFEKTLRVAVYPFVAVDTVKIALAILIGRNVKRRLPKP